MAAPFDAQDLKSSAVQYIESLWRRVPEQTDEELRLHASKLLSPHVIFHADGVIYPEDLTGIVAFVKAVRVEQQAYKLIDFQPVVVAVDEFEPAVFMLSSYRVQPHVVGERPFMQNSYSEGVQVDELRFDAKKQIVHGWVRRQMTNEERVILVRDPVHHQPATFDLQKLRPIQAESAVQRNEYIESMNHAMTTWIMAWNLTAETGEFNFDALDTILAPTFTLHDALGIRGKPQDAVQNIRSAQDAKTAIADFTSRYNCSESVVSHAASDEYNVAFSHWRARIFERVIEGGANFSVDATDVALFDEHGRIAEIFQFRTPVGFERREVLYPVV